MPHQFSISELRQRLLSREISSREATQACLDRIATVDERVKAFVSCDSENALAQADVADRALGEGGHDDQPLLGVPIALKDVLAQKGEPLRCCSKILGDFVAPYTATAVAKLEAAGAVVFGRLNMDEFAMGSSTENSAFQTTRNPWDLERVPGGSSGGSAAAVAADECIASIGSDTGGSIRQPAAFCGVVGVKPTYGRVSRYGLVAFASSLDQIGPFTKTVEDSARMLSVLCGHDGRDSTSAPQPVPDFASDLNGDIKGMKIGIPREYDVTGTDPEVKTATDAAIAQLKSLGAEVMEVSLPHTEYAIASYYIVATAEASSNLARFDGIRYGLRVDGDSPVELYSKSRGAGFGPEVKRRIILGTYVLSSGYYDAYYLRAQKVRRLIRQDFEKAFEQVDVIATPPTPAPAFKVGEVSNPLDMYLADIFTVPASLAGIPGMCLPCGQTTGGLPIGLQLLAKPFDEASMLRVGHAFEQSTDWHRARPADL
jgi:aspartyl-tRNA(Asn)/glutamyl-tRNA(Gln) amidotransferase subunit A